MPTGGGWLLPPGFTIVPKKNTHTGETVAVTPTRLLFVHKPAQDLSEVTGATLDPYTAMRSCTPHNTSEFLSSLKSQPLEHVVASAWSLNANGTGA